MTRYNAEAKSFGRIVTGLYLIYIAFDIFEPRVTGHYHDYFGVVGSFIYFYPDVDQQVANLFGFDLTQD